MSKYVLIPIGSGGGITPTGTLEIRSEGTFDVTNYAEVDVDIFDDTTTKTINQNGTYNAEDDQVLGYSQVTVQVPASAVDTGTKQDTISTNGTSTIDVVGYANHEITVNVPQPSGTLQTSITQNGTTTVNVNDYANNEITVNVQDSGTLTIEPITSNVTLFTQDVRGYAAIAFQVDVQPTLEAKTNIAPTTSSQTITCGQGYDGLSSVQINAVDYTIDSNIVAGNIKNGVTILGVTGNYAPNLQAKTNIAPTTSSQTISPDQNYDGLSSVQINAVTSAIDANITAGNIKDGVTILGVTGNYTPTILTMTQAEYDALAPNYDQNTIYLIN